MSSSEWISVGQVVDLLEVSDKTVRRRIAAKRYRSKYVKGKFGDELRVSKEDVLKDVHTFETPGQGEISQEESEGYVGTSGHLEEQREDESMREQNAAIAIEKPQNLRIVIADDSDAMVKFLNNLLQKLKVEIAGVAKDGVKALELIEAEKPDVVIAEVALPGMDGFELAQEKAKRKEIGQVQLAFLSYMREHAIVQEARQYPGVQEYFSKPLIGDELSRFRTWMREMKKQKEEGR